MVFISVVSSQPQITSTLVNPSPIPIHNIHHHFPFFHLISIPSCEVTWTSSKYTDYCDYLLLSTLDIIIPITPSQPRHEQY